MARREVDPAILISADPDTVFASLEDLRLTVKRPAPGNRLPVTVKLEQDQEWLAISSRDVTLRAGDTIAVLTIPRGDFKSQVPRNGALTATVDEVDGYETADAKATVHVISQEAPVVSFSLSRGAYTFAEDVERASAQFVARMAPGMPRGVTVGVLFATRGEESSIDGLTATGGEDYESVDGGLLMMGEKYGLEDGRWVGRTDLILPLLDDDVREGTETFELLLQPISGEIGVAQLVAADGTPCGLLCQHLIHITDDEDIPTMDLAVNPGQIMEEGQTSATATLSIADDKSFAADQAVTLALAGTATRGADYVVSPPDADQQTADYQVVLPVESASVQVTFKAMRDEVDDPGEKIEVSPSVDGTSVGDMKAIRIMNRQVQMPAITLAASRDTIIAGLEGLTLTATRQAPLDSPIAVTLEVTQAQNWLSRTSFQLNFAARGSRANLVLPRSLFSSEVAGSGNLTLTVDSISGYDTADATATVYVVSEEGPAVSVSLTHSSYRFPEDGEDTDLIVTAQMASGMPRGATVSVSVSSEGRSSSSPELTAASPIDYMTLSKMAVLREEEYALEDGSWVAHRRVSVTLVDDDVREGRETFRVELEHAPGQIEEVRLLNPDTTPCSGDGECRYLVFIDDDEDIPDLDLSVSEAEISEEEGTSSTATVAITNGKTFADDQVVTFELGGDAIPGHDYTVTPADANGALADHQVTLPAGSASVEATFTAVDDEREEGGEKIRLSATHDGNAIGSGTIRIIDRFPGPRVEITFEGVQPPRDEYDDGIATGPFTTRITFSEQVEGFTQEDIDWQTHSLTTVDTTNIGVLLWDYAEVRAGLEYTARMMPDQDGRLHIGVVPGSARSVAAGDGNQLGHGSLQVELPPDRLIVEPGTLTVDEGDADGAHFLVLLTSEPTGPVTVMFTGADGTDLTVDRPSLTFTLPYWNGGFGVRVTARDDADTADEQVRLWAKASGGGYGGRSVDLVVNVRDDDGASADQPRVVGPLQTGPEEALKLLGDVTPDAAAAALLGEGGLSEAQLSALDRLGNRNGRYDLGDMLSWAVRCRRAERSNRPRRRRSRGYPRGRRSDGPGRRRRGRARTALAFLAAITLSWGCDQGRGLVEPLAGEPEPGFLAVELMVPAGAHLGGAWLAIEGPDVGALRAPGSEVFESEDGNRKEVIVAGALSAGRILEFRVPDRRLDSHYRVRLIEVTGEDFAPRDLSAYSARISR
ncbi:Calx-beta domain-containing protein [Candidatus Palauibacter sp.]|uniref:Calx-beta domain-containing protein n=1 Tax=Candidatus Palauibacter sp. TaxID=3101350 RepID=UPI003B520B1D